METREPEEENISLNMVLAMVVHHQLNAVGTHAYCLQCRHVPAIASHDTSLGMSAGPGTVFHSLTAVSTEPATDKVGESHHLYLCPRYYTQKIIECRF